MTYYDVYVSMIKNFDDIGNKINWRKNKKFEYFINPEIIDKIFLMIKIIYNAVVDFVKLLEEFENKKLYVC